MTEKVKIFSIIFQKGWEPLPAIGNYFLRKEIRNVSDGKKTNKVENQEFSGGETVRWNDLLFANDWGIYGSRR